MGAERTFPWWFDISRLTLGVLARFNDALRANLMVQIALLVLAVCRTSISLGSSSLVSGLPQSLGLGGAREDMPGRETATAPSSEPSHPATAETGKGHLAHGEHALSRPDSLGRLSSVTRLAADMLSRMLLRASGRSRSWRPRRRRRERRLPGLRFSSP